MNFHEQIAARATLVAQRGVRIRLSTQLGRWEQLTVRTQLNGERIEEALRLLEDTDFGMLIFRKDGLLAYYKPIGSVLLGKYECIVRYLCGIVLRSCERDVQVAG